MIYAACGSFRWQAGRQGGATFGLVIDPVCHEAQLAWPGFPCHLADYPLYAAAFQGIGPEAEHQRVGKSFRPPHQDPSWTRLTRPIYADTRQGRLPNGSI